MPTAEFSSAIDIFHQDLLRDIDALRALAHGQHKHISYQGTYNAYVLGVLSEDEFVADSEKFVVEPRDLPPQEVADTIERLNRLLEFDLNESEIADYFELQPECVNAAVDLVNQKQLQEQAAAINSAKYGIAYDKGR